MEVDAFLDFGFCLIHTLLNDVPCRLVMTVFSCISLSLKSPRCIIVHRSVVIALVVNNSIIPSIILHLETLWLGLRHVWSVASELRSRVVLTTRILYNDKWWYMIQNESVN